MDAHPRFSDESEGSDQLSGPPDLARSPTPPSSRTPPLDDDYSMQDNGPMTTQDRPRRLHRDKNRHSAHREFMELLVSDHQEAKQTRKFLRSALARLDNETVRRQEAEQRALELAARFKVVNEERLRASEELQRVNEELRLYKIQYDNAQREISRGQKILEDMEAQRDDAEAAAARARTTARKLREQQLVLKAREEGRKAGYQEGLRRGTEQARLERARLEGGDGIDATEPNANEGVASVQDDGTATLDSRADPLTELPVRNFTSPSPSVPLESPTPRRRTVPPSLQPGPQDPQVSRFHEHGIGISPAPTQSTLPNANPQWDEPPIRPISVSNMPQSSHHPETHIPPDNWIPEMDENNRIHLPPPHEMQRPQTPVSPTPVPIPPPGSGRPMEPQQPFISRDYAHHKSTPSIDSVATSLSTTVSQFDLVNSPRQAHRNLGSNDRKLSTIHEVASSADFTPRQSPSISKQPSFDTRSPAQRQYEREREWEREQRERDQAAVMPEPIVFPGVPPVSQQPEEPPATVAFSPRSRAQSQLLSDALRYGDPAVAEEIRRSASDMRSNPSTSSLRKPSRLTKPAPLGGPLPPPAPAPQDFLRPSSTVGSTMLGPNSMGGSSPQRSRSAMSQRSDRSSLNARSSQEITIRVESPSEPPSAGFSPPRGEEWGMLSPSGPVAELPPAQPVIPTVPNSPRMGQFQSMGTLADPSGSAQRVNMLPPGFIPSAPPTPAPGANPILIPPSAQPISRAETPRINIYSPTPPAAVPELQRSVSSSSTAPNNYPKAMHSRSRSAGQASLESLNQRSKTPIIRPPSSASGGAGSIYQAAPIPAGVTYPAPPGPPIGVPSRADTGTPQSTTSKMSGHTRSRSMYAGSTPALSTSRPLSTAPPPKLRRVPSDASNDSAMSGFSRTSRKEYAHFEPRGYVDPAYLASSEELPLSPNTHANTRANAQLGGLPPGNRSSDALSYVSLQNRTEY